MTVGQPTGAAATLSVGGEHRDGLRVVTGPVRTRRERQARYGLRALHRHPRQVAGRADPVDDGQQRREYLSRPVTEDPRILNGQMLVVGHDGDDARQLLDDVAGYDMRRIDARDLDRGL